jgi:hypothetical protein
MPRLIDSFIHPTHPPRTLTVAVGRIGAAPGVLASLASYSRRINLAASTTALAYVEKREREGTEKGGGKRRGEGMRPPCMFELGGVMCVTV